MIMLNDTVIEIGSYPDGTILMKPDRRAANSAYIEWNYENDREFLVLIYLVKHLRDHRVHTITLHMPYIPNARMDRVKGTDDVFTLKYFADILNSLELDRVWVMDPHSDVSTALINNVCTISPKSYIYAALSHMKLVEDVDTDHIIMFYPDNGAAKRYGNMVSRPYAYGAKNRDWETGKILGLDVITNGLDLTGKDILIVDDICSKGGTFLHSAKKLKELGVNRIYLYISHCENTILEGEMLTSGLIEKVYTTDSIFTKEHEMIEVLK